MRHTAQHVLAAALDDPQMSLDELATVALRYVEVSEWLLAYVEVVSGRPGRN